MITTPRSIQAGLYEQWRKETLRDTVRETRARKRDQLKISKEMGIDALMETDEASAVVRPLTVTHIQGPLIILLVGLFSASTSFIVEKLAAFRPINKKTNKYP